MSIDGKVAVITIDANGSRKAEVLSINDALLAVLRFARKHPQSSCTIELREREPLTAAPAIEVFPLDTTEPEHREQGTGNTIVRAFAPRPGTD